MRYVTGAKRHICVFISYSAEDDNEARYYERLLKRAGFDAFRYAGDLSPGGAMESVIRRKITQCHFFLFVVSDHSLRSPWVQRELGLAITHRRENQDYRPAIIPLYAKSARWRKSGRMPRKFSTRNFDTRRKRAPFNLRGVRGLDRHANPKPDAWRVLIEQMIPHVLVSRLDFKDEATFHQTKFFDLYEDIFPPKERDDPRDVINWVLGVDHGKRKTFFLSDGTSISYKLDSRCFILSLGGQAIGLAFFTYDHSSKFIYGNYVAVQKCWRGGEIAQAFLEKIMSIQSRLFQSYQGVVFEVEIFDRKRIERIITRLERGGKFSSEEERDEIRRFIRIQWYQKLDCVFFVDNHTEEPLVCTAPCIAPSTPRSRWQELEEGYWIMWRGRPGSTVDVRQAQTLWGKAVKCIYVEILIKSLVGRYLSRGPAYWQYANAVIDRGVRMVNGKGVGFNRFVDWRDTSLYSRWEKLGIDLPI